MAVLFDLDGTIIGGKRNKRKIMDECAEELGISKISRKKYHDVFREVMRDSKAETRIPVFEKIIGNRDIAERMAKMYGKRSLDNSLIHRDAEEVLENLDVKKGLLTNGPRQVQWEKINSFDLEKYFDVIAISGEIGMSKPGKEIFHFALDKLDSKPENSIYVGDVPSHDVAGARNAGLVSVLIDRHDGLNGPDPHYKINDLRELYGILDEIEGDV